MEHVGIRVEQARNISYGKRDAAALENVSVLVADVSHSPQLRLRPRVIESNQVVVLCREQKNGAVQRFFSFFSLTAAPSEVIVSRLD